MSAVADAEIRVRVHAGARGGAQLRVEDGVIVVRVPAPAREGRANKALCRLLAKQLRTAPSNVTIVRGEHARDKLIRVAGVDQAAANDALGIRTG
jgi:uncharacterized protein